MKVRKWRDKVRNILLHNCRFLTCFRDPIRVPRIENRFPRIRENRVPKIREIGSLEVHTGYLTFSLKKADNCVVALPS